MQISILKLQKSTLVACVLAIVLFVLSGFGRDALAANKVTICHKGKQTAAVLEQAVSAHLGHGDSLGACGAISPPPEGMVAVVMIRCAPNDDGVVEVVAFSSSPAVGSESDDCALVLAELLDAGYGIKSITAGSAGGGDLELYTDYLLLGKANDDDDEDDDDDDDEDD